MKKISLNFQIHQPWRLKSYRFFSIGNDHNYLDDRANRSLVQRMASSCYLPMNALLLSLIESSKGAFRCSFSISGVAVEQFRAYAPEVLNSFRSLADTGCVEFVAETYSHSLSSLTAGAEFEDEVRSHLDLIEAEFGLRPTTFRNTEMIYSDIIGDRIAKIGFDAVLADGSSELLEWRSPNYIYSNVINSDLKLLLRNQAASCDFAKQSLFVGDLEHHHGDVVNLFVEYSNFNNESAFDSLRSTVAAILESENLAFDTVGNLARSAEMCAVAELGSAHITSCRGGITDLLGNELQDESFVKLHALYAAVAELNDKSFNEAWHLLRSSDHLYYMATKWLTASNSDSNLNDDGVNPYNTSYEAFINFMNILSDFDIELRKALEAQREEQLKRLVKAKRGRRSTLKSSSDLSQQM